MLGRITEAVVFLPLSIGSHNRQPRHQLNWVAAVQNACNQRRIERNDRTQYLANISRILMVRLRLGRVVPTKYHSCHRSSNLGVA